MLRIADHQGRPVGMRNWVSRAAGASAAALLFGCTGPSAPPPPPAAPAPPAAAASSTPPEWLYPKVVRAVVKDPNAPRHVPGSPVTYTDGQLHDLFTTLDWRPEQHPPMPPVVAKGRQPDVQACGYCHLATGQGRPESAPSLACRWLISSARCRLLRPTSAIPAAPAQWCGPTAPRAAA